MTHQPDEDHDVIVYEYRHTWAIWLGDELQGVAFTREAARDLTSEPRTYAYNYRDSVAAGVASSTSLSSVSG